MSARQPDEPLGPTIFAAALAFFAILAVAHPARPPQPETDDMSLPKLAELLLPACEYAESLVQEADEGDAPPDVFSSLCRNSERLWEIYHNLKEDANNADDFSEHQP